MITSDAAPIKALLIEDAARLAALTREYLTSHGLVRSRAPTGPYALQEVGARRFDVVRLDLHLPGLDGVEVCRRMRARSSVPIIMLTARDELAGRTLSHEQLFDLAKGSADDSFDRSIDVHISRRRSKLADDARRPALLKTVRGIGYRLATR